MVELAKEREGRKERSGNENEKGKVSHFPKSCEREVKHDGWRIEL